MQSLALEHCAPPLLFVFFPTTGTAPARQQQRRSLFVKYSRFWAFQQGVDSFFLPVTLRRGLRGLRFWTECPIIEPVLISYHYNVLILQEALCSIWITLPTPLWTRRCCNASVTPSGVTQAMPMPTIRQALPQRLRWMRQWPIPSMPVPAGIIYTSGASEANNLAVKGLAALGGAAGRHILSSPLEHSSVSGSLEALQKQGYEVELLDILPDGTVDLADLKKRLRPDTVLVAVTAVDSELGVVQPIAEIAELLKAYPNCHFHVDATQAVGKIPVQFEGMDTMSLTAHKFYGLNGIGVLVKRLGLALPPLIHGGESTTPYRSGTPTVALACSLALALEKATAELSARAATVRSLNDRLRTELSRYPKVRINSPANAVPHILNLSVQGIKGTVFQRELDARGVCVSVKSACSSDGLPSRAVLAVSQNGRNALSSWRISLSHLTTEEEVTGFLHAFADCYNTLTR